jgi:hypothetical protein
VPEPRADSAQAPARARWPSIVEVNMASTKQKAAARRNIKKAASAAQRQKTISKLPKKTRTALGKQASKVARQKRSSSR